MTTLSVSVERGRLLALAMRADALVSSVFGVALLIGGPLLTEVLGMPLAVLWAVGVVCVAYGVGLWRGLVGARVAVGLNFFWVLGSVGVVVLGVLPLTGVGVGFVVLQAVCVELLADAQVVGLVMLRQ